MFQSSCPSPLKKRLVTPVLSPTSAVYLNLFYNLFSESSSIWSSFETVSKESLQKQSEPVFDNFWVFDGEFIGKVVQHVHMTPRRHKLYVISKFMDRIHCQDNKKKISAIGDFISPMGNILPD